MALAGACDMPLHIHDPARPAAPGAHNPGEAGIPMYRARRETIHVWAPVAATRRRIPADNPAEPYGL